MMSRTYILSRILCHAYEGILCVMSHTYHVILCHMMSRTYIMSRIWCHALTFCHAYNVTHIKVWHIVCHAHIVSYYVTHMNILCHSYSVTRKWCHLCHTYYVTHLYFVTHLYSVTHIKSRIGRYITYYVTCIWCHIMSRKSCDALILRHAYEGTLYMSRHTCG